VIMENPVSNTSETSLASIERMEGRLLQMEQVNIPLEEHFAPGVYYRQVAMPKGSLVIGHCHKTEHLNVIISGRASVVIDGERKEIIAPSTFKSSAFVRKVLYIHEDMIWATIHPTDETDLIKLEEQLIEKSTTFYKHATSELEGLRQELLGDQL